MRARSHHSRTARRLGVLAVAVAALLPGLAVGSTATAAPASVPSTGILLGHGGFTPLRAKHTPAWGHVPARVLPSAKVSTVHSSFVVTYHGFPSEPKAAFQRAVDLWSILVKSSVPIRIDATWTTLGAGILGGAGPSDFIRGFSGAPNSNDWYPLALANARHGTDLASDEADIDAEFASNRSDWYFGDDGQTPFNKLDFTSVVLHEIGHGLGLTDSTDLEAGKGSWGGGTSIPFAYDTFVQTSAGQPITSIATPSTTLASVYQSNAVRWGGTQAINAAGGTKPYIYSPNPFEYGSSIAHLDEDEYPTGSANGLMTPYLDDGESFADPGDIALGMMRDLGWTTVGGKGVPAAPALDSALGGNQKVALAWHTSKDTGRQFLTGIKVSRYLGNATSPQAVTTYPADTTGAVISGLTNGTAYRFSVAAVNATGTGAQSGKSESIKPVAMGPFTYSSHLVRQQFIDFQGRAATAAEVATWDTYLHSGSFTPGGVVAGIAALPAPGTSKARMTRLYSAFFARLPDLSGFNYWVGKLNKGTSLKHASDTFAASSEFKNKYGTLSSSAFVTLVYQNVLHRAPDAAGKAHWVKKLDTKALSRGSVMLNFSESSENTRKMASEVSSVLLRTGMLRRMPTTTEYAADVAFLDAPHTAAELATTFLSLPAYTSRVTP